jgi:hypothetical protein
MNRFFGMMPSSEIEISKSFKDENGLEITIDAGPHGWTIIYADYSTKYEDVDDTAENNFNKAFSILTKEFAVREVVYNETNRDVDEG